MEKHNGIMQKEKEKQIAAEQTPQDLKNDFDF